MCNYRKCGRKWRVSVGAGEAGPRRGVLAAPIVLAILARRRVTPWRSLQSVLACLSFWRKLLWTSRNVRLIWPFWQLDLRITGITVVDTVTVVRSRCWLHGSRWKPVAQVTIATVGAVVQNELLDGALVVTLFNLAKAGCTTHHLQFWVLVACRTCCLQDRAGVCWCDRCGISLHPLGHLRTLEYGRGINLAFFPIIFLAGISVYLCKKGVFRVCLGFIAGLFRDCLSMFKLCLGFILFRVGLGFI